MDFIQKTTGIKDDVMNKQVELIFNEHKVNLAFEESKAYTLLTYFIAVSDAIQRAPKPVTAFGNFFLVFFGIVLILCIFIPCLSGIYRMTMWELANISVAGAMLALVTYIKNQIGLTTYVAEKCNSPWCNPDYSPMAEPTDEYADTYDEIRRLYKRGPPKPKITKATEEDDVVSEDEEDAT